MIFGDIEFEFNSYIIFLSHPDFDDGGIFCDNCGVLIHDQHLVLLFLDWPILLNRDKIGIH